MIIHVFVDIASDITCCSHDIQATSVNKNVEVGRCDN